MIEELVYNFILAVVLIRIMLPVLKYIFKQDWRRVVLVQILGYFLILYPYKPISAYLYDWFTGYGYPPKWIMTLEHSLFVILLIIVPAIYAEIITMKWRVISTCILMIPIILVIMCYICVVMNQYLFN